MPKTFLLNGFLRLVPDKVVKISSRESCCIRLIIRLAFCQVWMAFVSASNCSSERATLTVLPLTFRVH